ncbi:hypothetical protein IJG04_02730 [Candidatus Saccharibacteria bacterium]|nr:hypothetical protein [Candidatus Saccharibacteria bacterium]
MANKSAKSKNKSNKKDVKVGKLCQGDAQRFLTMLVVALIAIIIGITVAFTLNIQQLKNELNLAQQNNCICEEN